MSQANGTGRRRVRAIPKTVTFEIDVLRIVDGEPKEVTLELVGHHRDCPDAFVVVQQEAARQDYLQAAYVDIVDPETGQKRPLLHRETSKPLFDPQTGDPLYEQRFEYRHEHEVRYRRDTLMAVIPGLEEADANVLARDGGPWLDMLRDLGWWSAPSENEDDDPEAAGEAEREAPTTAPSSPDSAPSTDPTTGSA